VRVIVAAREGQADAAAAAVQAVGGVVETRYESLVQARVAPTLLQMLAADPAVRWLRAPERVEPMAVSGEGVSASAASVWHSAGLRGAGARVAIIDFGFAGYTDRQASGDLPASLTTTNFCADGFTTRTKHGTSVAEIVHEMAPDAQLVLICAETIPETGNAKDYVKQHGITIVNSSVGDNYGRGDGSPLPGTRAEIVADAAASGILWVNAAGNSGDTHWSGAFVDSNADKLHEFTGIDVFDDVTIYPGESLCVTLRWDSWPTSADDFDLLLWDFASADIVASSMNRQGQAFPPIEGLCTTYSGSGSASAALVIARFAGSGSPRFDLFYDGYDTPEYVVSAGSIAEPATSPNVLAVGAICWQSDSLQPYSSQGPNIAGLTKPDIAGVDAVSSATYGPASGCSGGFTGTSASSPHVAGAAALWKGMGPSLGLSDLRSRLLGSTVDLGVSGADNLFGAGKLRMPTTSPTPVGYLAGSSTANSITVVGSVNPNGIAADAFLEYGATASYGSQTTAVPVGYGTSPVSTAPITFGGLSPATDYHVRLVARNPFGQATLSDALFSTNGPPAVVSQVSTPQTGGNAARPGGTVNSRGLPTTAYYEYGTTVAYGMQTPAVSTGTTLPTATPFAQAIDGLSPNTTYHYRLLATNAAGTATGADATFTTTSAQAPTVTTGPASPVSHDSATVKATVNTRGNLPTTLRAEYGTTTGYGSTTGPTEVPFGLADQTISIPLAGLAASTGYHYRVIAAGPYGQATGQDATFATTQAPPPGGGGGGGGGGTSVPDLSVGLVANGSVFAPGSEADLVATVTNKGGAGSLQTHLLIELPATMTLLGPPSYDRGSGCSGTQKIDCFLDYIPNGGSSKVVLAVRVSGSGPQSIRATASSDREANPADNVATLTLQVGAPVVPQPPAVVKPKPVFGKPLALPPQPLAGKRFTFTLAVKRSDTGAPLRAGRMVCDPTVAGKLIKHTESFKAGKARLTFVMPKRAKGKQLKIKIKIVSGSRSTTRVLTYKVH
jgi:subtilisin family serine protease